MPASQMLFGNMLTLGKGIFSPISERSSSSKPLSTYMSNLLANKDNLLKAGAEELLRTDLLHTTTKEQNRQKEYLPNYYTLILYRTGLPTTRLQTKWKVPMRVIKRLNSLYTLLDLITGKEKDYHVSDMKPFVFDSANNNEIPMNFGENISSQFRIFSFIFCIPHNQRT